MQDFTVFIGAEELKMYEESKGVKYGHNWTDEVIEEVKSKDGKLPGKWLGFKWILSDNQENQY